MKGISGRRFDIGLVSDKTTYHDLTLTNFSHGWACQNFSHWWINVMNGFEYESVRPSTREELVRQLESGDPKAVANALYAASKYDSDSIWVQDQCLKFLKSPDVPVRWAAATCLGDLAFLRRPLDVEVVLSALEQAAHDSQIADPAQFSISLVRQYRGPK